MVHLDAIDCCALWHAVVHQQKMTARWADFMGRLKLLRSILLTSTSLMFEPTDEIVAMYRSLAKAELQRLSARPNSLSCKHFSVEHRSALNGILMRLPGPVTH